MAKYHYCCTINGGLHSYREYRMDGIAILDRPIENMEDYTSLKLMLKECFGNDTPGVTVHSLTITTLTPLE